MSRILGLQDLLSTGNRVISSGFNVDEIDKMPNIDWEKVEMRIKQYRNSSRIYLRDAIEKEYQDVNNR